MFFPLSFKVLSRFAMSCSTPSSLARLIVCSWLSAFSASARSMLPTTAELTPPARASTSRVAFDLSISPMASPLSSAPSSQSVVTLPFLPKAGPKNSPSPGPIPLPWSLRTFSVVFPCSIAASDRRPSTPMELFTVSNLVRVVFTSRRDSAMAMVASACTLLSLSSSVVRQPFARSASANALPPRAPSSLLPIRSDFRHVFSFTASAISAPASEPMPFSAMPRCSNDLFDRSAFAKALPPMSPSSFCGIHSRLSVALVSRAIAIDAPPSGPSLLPSM
mmetsp:Transcript_46664/g.133521  ORF Transcript_46664/g.133521 Transcript_46664/m.133521 type:complete len:277 (-) Transcript_46664:2964-3794(-)